MRVSTSFFQESLDKPSLTKAMKNPDLVCMGLHALTEQHGINIEDIRGVSNKYFLGAE